MHTRATPGVYTRARSRRGSKRRAPDGPVSAGALQGPCAFFDELGRGISTYDGISIAWAIVEYIHEMPKCRAKTLFATHYHELNEMERSYRRIKNYNVSVREVDGKVLFIRKLVRGGSEHSFGIHVAKIAGMPPSVIKRADEILLQLESSQRQSNNVGKSMKKDRKSTV